MCGKNNRRENQGFSLLETVVGMALIFAVLSGFLLRMAAGEKLLFQEAEVRKGLEMAGQMALSGLGNPTDASFYIEFVPECGEKRNDEIVEEFAIYRADVPWENGEISLEFYSHE